MTLIIFQLSGMMNIIWAGMHPQSETVTVLSNSQETVSFTFKAPVQGIYAYDSMDFTVKATSQNSTTTSDSRLQTLDVDMIYAVDVSVRDPPQSGNAEILSITQLKLRMWVRQVKNLP